MFRLGRLLFGIAVAGAAAATVYNYLDQSNKETDDEFNDDFPEEGGAEPANEEDYTEKFKTAATRTYTTIKESSADAMAKVKEAIGPKGEEVLDVVGETAGKVVEEAVANALAEEMAAENDPVEVGESESSEAIHEDDHDKEAVYEEEFPEAAADEEAPAEKTEGEE